MPSSAHFSENLITCSQEILFEMRDPGRDRPDGELGIARCSQLPDHHHIQRSLEGPGHFVRHDDPSARQPEHHRLLQPVVNQAGRQLATGIAAPAGTPKEIVARLQMEVAKILQAPDNVKKLNDLGLEPGGIPSEELAAIIRSDIPRLGKVVRESGAKVD